MTAIVKLTTNPPHANPTMQGYVDAAVNAAAAKILGDAPPSADTLKELADAIAQQAAALAATSVTLLSPARPTRGVRVRGRA